MQIVIDIPEESYKFAKECKSKGSSKHSWNLSHNDIVLMIANGTPLSKEHGIINNEQLQERQYQAEDISKERE